MIPFLLALLTSPVPARLQEPPKPAARTELDKALAHAQHKNRRVLLFSFAEGSAPSASLLSALKKDEELQHELLYEYDLVVLNPTLDPDAAAVLRERGLGDVVGLGVLDAQGTLLAQQGIAAFRPDQGDEQASDPKKVLAFLAQQRAKPLDAEVQLRDALARAKATKRRVLIHAGAPW
jgi:hypothetical protein